ncbi:MAG: hypothetical protein ACSLE8_06230 [Rhodococcus sp. (in: high G+C Gram-positive bacteria)]
MSGVSDRRSIDRRKPAETKSSDVWKFVRERNGYAIQEKDGKFRTVQLGDKHLKT